MNDELRLRIESYLGGEMSSEEVVAFELEMENDPQLMAEVQLSRQINLHFSESEDPEAVPNNSYTRDLRSFLDSDEAAEIKETLRNVQLERRVPQLRRKRRRLVLVSVAASVLFLVSAIGLLFQSEPGTDKLYAQYYSTADLPSVIRRDDNSSLLESGVVAFQNGDLADAMAYFENYEASTEEPDVAVFLYKGATYMEQEQFFKAIEAFEVVIDSGSIDASKGFWFKAMAYLKAGDKNNAIHILEDIANHIWYFKHDQAKELLEKLD
ncbi:MAG: hypothetical protein AAF466_00035 [Bacteroidota bacterium]